MKKKIKVQYKRPTHEELLSNEKNIKELLINIYQANFENPINAKEVAELDYQKLLLFAKDRTAILFFAVLEEKLIGFLWAYFREVIGEKKLHIKHIIIDEPYRGQGIGKELIHCLEEHNRSELNLPIELIASLSNEQAMRFYRSLGFIQKRVFFEKSEEDK